MHLPPRTNLRRLADRCYEVLLAASLFGLCIAAVPAPAARPAQPPLATAGALVRAKPAAPPAQCGKNQSSTVVISR